MPEMTHNTGWNGSRGSWSQSKLPAWSALSGFVLFLLVVLMGACERHVSLDVHQTRYSLNTESGKVYIVDQRNRRIVVPPAWLGILPGGKSGWSGHHYFEQINAFSIGGGYTGLHLVALRKGGEDHNSLSGRDVFLVLNPSGERLYLGGVVDGPSMSKKIYYGCTFVFNHRYYIADVDRDGYVDIGVKRESLSCHERFNPETGGITLTAPVHQASSIQWHVFRTTKWSKREPVEKVQKQVLSRPLPLIGMEKTLVQQNREKQNTD